MPSHTTHQRQTVQNGLKALTKMADLRQAGHNFFGQALGYDTSREGNLDGTYADFAATYQTAEDEKFNEAKALVDHWRSVHLLFQLTEEEMVKTVGLFDDQEVDRVIMESYIFVAIDLERERYSRTDLAQITRQVNRLFRQPVLLLFRYGVPAAKLLTLAVIDRRLNKRDRQEDDVLKKVTFVKDIDLANPNRAHIDILTDLHRKQIQYRDKRGKQRSPRNFVELHRAWRDVLSVSELNKRFYRELSDWFFWATGHDKSENGPRATVAFPSGQEMSNEARSRAVIRMITRIIFVWFLKEKGLVPEHLFDQSELKRRGIDFGKDSAYYKVILQNLFFATLNTKVGNRDVMPEHTFQGRSTGKDNKSLLRYPELCTGGPATLKALFAGIPFLNGGLFECLDTQETLIDCFSQQPAKQPYVPNELFFREDALEVDLNDTYGTKGRHQVCGLFTILKSYKFTIDENTPVDEEVALDPELLGKVFENLLAAYNKETSDTARRQTGSFYTPREIVNYMVEEGLIAYLEDYILRRIKPKATGPKFQPLQMNMFDLTPAVQTEFDFDNSHNDDDYRVSLRAKLRRMVSFNQDRNPFASERERQFMVRAIDEMRILDPAVGSGAYPMGVLQLLVHVLKKIDPDNSFWGALQKEKDEARSQVQGKEERADELAYDDKAEFDYNRKLYLIRNCIHGVDIQPIAIQICKLRFFVSLAINERRDDSKKNFGVRHLPNLETKFVAADTLIKLYQQAPGLIPVAAQDKQDELRRLRIKSFNLKSRAAKKKNRHRDEELREKIRAILVSGGWPTGVANRIAQWNPYDQKTCANWFDPEWMFGLSTGFDLVIGNPPYRQIHKYGDETRNVWRTQNYGTYVATGDIYSLFYERGVELLKTGGILSYITSNNWMRAKYGEKTRKFFASQNPLILVDFGMAQMFESATTYTNIMVLQKGNNERKTKMVRVRDDFDAKQTELVDYVTSNSSTQSNLNENSWVAYTQKEYELKRRVEKQGVPLKDWDLSINRGILTGYNAAFIIDQAKRDELVAADPKSEEIIRPILRGRDIRAWVPAWSGNYLIGTFPALKLNIDDYPAIKAYLEPMRERLEPKPRGYKGKKWGGRKSGSYRWFETQDSISYHKEFYQPKVIYPNMTNSLPFTYDRTNHYFCNDKAFILSGGNLGFLASLLNSPLFKFFFKDNFPELLGNSYEVRKVFFEKIKLKKPENNKSNLFERLADYILSAKKPSELSSVALYFEQLVNGLVYELYFPAELRRAGITLLEYLTEEVLPVLPEEDASAAETIRTTYARLYDKAHPVRIGLFKLDTVPEVRLIEGRGKK